MVRSLASSPYTERVRRLALPVHDAAVQLNSVGHTGADGFTRLANLAGFIRGQGGEILGATVLTGKPYSAKLAPDEARYGH